MGIQVGFYLRDLQEAVAKNTGYKIQVDLKIVPPQQEAFINEDGNWDWRWELAYRDDEVTVTDPNGNKFNFRSSYGSEENIRFWFSNKNINYDLLELLDELKVPYDRG